MTDVDPKVVSLRVPGVTFPEAESVLGGGSAAQVDDADARGEFWRWRRPGPEQYTSEAYLWGLRSTATARALWLLLLPFTLVNVAYWARPARPRGITSWAADALASILFRLLALTLTATLMLGIAGVTMDLIGFQCLGVRGDCSKSWPQPFNLLGELPLATNQWLAVGALAPMLVLVVLWLVSYRTWQRYERTVELAPPVDRLTEARFGRGPSWVERLRATHVTAGLAVVDTLLVYDIMVDDLRNGRPIGVAGAVLMVSLVLSMLTAVVGAVAPLPLASPDVHAVRDGATVSALRRSRRLAAGARAHAWLADRADEFVASYRQHARAASQGMRKTMRAAAWTTIGITVCCLGYAVAPRGNLSPASGTLPGFAGGVAILSVLQVTVLVALGATLLPLCWIARGRPGRLVWHGFVAPVIATVAAMLATVEAAGLLYFAALTIGQLETSGTSRAWQPAPPYPYEWAGLAFVVAMAASIAAAIVHGLRWQHKKRVGRGITDARDGRLRHRQPDAAELLDRAHARGGILETVPALALIVFVPVAALSLAGVLFSAFGQGPATLLPAPKALTNLGAWSIGPIVIGLVIATARSGNLTPARRLVSAVYAMGTFWPRAAHPFGGPSHGPRAVSDIVRRVTTLTARDTPVLLAGHSHGSVLVATALRYLPAEALARTAVLTTACPLTRLIEPLFAAFFDQHTVAALAHRLSDGPTTRWINLYRITDPIGGPVLIADRTGQHPGGGGTAPIDELAADPPDQDLVGPEPRIRGHDSYLQDPAFHAAHARLVRCLQADQGVRDGRDPA